MIIVIPCAKKIVSFTLSNESIEKIAKTSKTLGVSRSELMEFLITEHFPMTEDVRKTLDKIEVLQKEAQEKLKARNLANEK